MLLITNYQMNKVENGLEFPDGNDITPSIVYGELNSSDGVVSDIGSHSFMDKIKNHEKPDILFYIHGFNNHPQPDILPRAKRLQTLIDLAGKDVLVIPIIWPCDDDLGVIKDYWDDQESAELSGPIFSRLLGKLMDWQQSNRDNPCMKRMHVISHSMGNRVLMKTLNHFATNTATSGVPLLFKNVFMMAPDIPSHSLEKGEEGQWITQASFNVRVYHAQDDLAMPSSKAVNAFKGVFNKRLGQWGVEDMSKVSTNVTQMDCSEFNQRFDKIAGHAYFLDKKGLNSPALNDMLSRL